MKVVFLSENKSFLGRVYPENVQEYLKKHTDFDLNAYDKNDVLNNPFLFSDTEYIFSTWGMPIFSENEIEKFFPNLKCVFYAAGSVQHFARPFLNCGVKVFSAWAANAVPVAEYTVAQIILANKGYFKCASLKAKDEHKPIREIFKNYNGNYNATVGIIGAGMIGKLVIKMLSSYNLNILVFDPFLPDSLAEDLGVKKVSLEELFSSSNVISNHLADNLKTKGIFTKKLFEQMPPYSTFLNTGRGAQVIEKDLIEVLLKRPDILAILDVTFPEPPEDSSPLYSLENCILTPHIAGSSGKEVYRMAEYILEEFKAFSKNLPTKYEVTLEMLETMA